LIDVHFRISTGGRPKVRPVTSRDAKIPQAFSWAFLRVVPRSIDRRTRTTFRRTDRDRHCAGETRRTWWGAMSRPEWSRVARIGTGAAISQSRVIKAAQQPGREKIGSQMCRDEECRSAPGPFSKAQLIGNSSLNPAPAQGVEW